MKKRYIITLITCLFLGLGLPEAALATGTGLPFQVHIKHNDYQSPDVGSYYKWNVSGGEEVVGTFVIENIHDKPVEVEVMPVNAVTSPSGNLDYITKGGYENKQGRILDDAFLFSNYVSVPERILLQPKEQRTVNFTVQVPNLSVSGDLIGGLRFQEVKEKTPSLQGGLTLFEQIDQIIAVYLNYSNKPPIVIDISDIEIEETDEATHEIIIPIKNQSPRLINDFHGKVILTNKDTNESVELDVGPFNIAPVTEVNHRIPIQKLDSENYHVTFSYIIDNDGKSLSKTFNLEDQSNDSTEKKQETNNHTSFEYSNNDMQEGKSKTEKYIFLWSVIISIIFCFFVLAIIKVR